MTSDELKDRTKKFALRIITVAKSLPRTLEGNIIGKQLIRAGTSVGANYRAACRAKSKSDFIYKIRVIEEEADETCYWFELIEESGMLSKKNLHDIHQEATELTAIFTSIGKTSKENLRANPKS